MKQLVTDPSIAAMQAVEAGATVTGRVSKIMAFGAFIELAPGVEGLVHISEISHERIPTVDKALRANEVVTAKVLSIDVGKKRISLSIKALIEPPARPEPQSVGGAGGGAPGKGPRVEEGFAAAFGRNRARNDVPSVERAKDNSLERLRASWGSGKELKGGLS
jgi:small subunit ribosomal protein S1